MKVATWNINSVRARIERLRVWLDRRAPDVVCLQEIKVHEEQFPFDAVEQAGYHVTVVGQKTYNGVAILSRHEPDDVIRAIDSDSDDVEARFAAVTLDDTCILSAYAPLGTAVGSERWDYKLEWFNRLRAYLERNLRPSDRVLLCGDLNVAPEDRDVARPREHQSRFVGAGGRVGRCRKLGDLGRELVPVLAQGD